MRLSVLCATMDQNDLSKFKTMHIRSDVIFANQCDRNETVSISLEGHKVTVLSTATRGVGLNRNLALLAADSEIVLFADDDMTYYDGYAEAVVRAFDELPEADLLVFSVDLVKNGQIIEKRRNTVRKLHTWNSLKYGACVLAARRASLLRARVSFSHLFGGGCIYGSGEDSLFLLDCLHKGLRLYSHSFVLGACSKDSSSWFTGYHEKFFYDKGAWIAAAFPRTGALFRLYFSYRYRGKTDIPMREMRCLMRRGQKGYQTLLPWSEGCVNCETGTDSGKQLPV